VGLLPLLRPLNPLEHRIKLLVVDDTPDVRALVRMSAELDGRFAEVLEAVDGADAVRACTAAPDVEAVVLDFEMPNGNGVEVLPTLRQLLPDARIVLFTSNGAIALEAVAVGADAVLEKHTPLPSLFDALVTGTTATDHGR
jgi:two-component system response regulator RegA